VSVNGLDNVISVENVALEGTQTVKCCFNLTLTGQAGRHIEVRGRVDGGSSDRQETEAVKCVVLDDYLGDKLSNVDVIKIDIEGAEGLRVEGDVENN